MTGSKLQRAERSISVRALDSLRGSRSLGGSRSLCGSRSLRGSSSLRCSRLVQRPFIASIRGLVASVVVLCGLSASILAPSARAHASGTPDKIVFDPKSPSKLWKLFTVEHHLALQSLRMEDNGVEQNAQQGLNLDAKLTLRALDEYKACSGGRPTLLGRKYDEAGLHVDVAFQSHNGDDKVGTDVIRGKSPFEGLSVLFTWVPSEKEYGKFYDALEGDESYLPELSEDLDMLSLLPGKEVSPGDEWTIDPASLVDWVAPGGQIPMNFDRSKGDRFARTLNLGVGGGLTMVFGGDVKGKVRARYESREQKGEASLAVIALDVDVETDRDQTRAGRNMLSADELLDGVSVQHSGVKWKAELQGKARWNLTLNRVESFELVGREEVAYELRLAMRQGGRSVQNMSLSGGMRIQCLTGPEAAKAKDKARPDDRSRPAQDSRADKNGQPGQDEKDRKETKGAKDEKGGKDGR
jgi:hypothetical protein